MIATKVETWKRTQKKNERRRAVARKRVLHRRIMNRLPVQEVTARKMAGAIVNEKKPEVNRVLQMPAQKPAGLFNKVKSILSFFKSQRGN